MAFADFILFHMNNNSDQAPSSFPTFHHFQSNRKFFWWQPCKLPQQHWHFASCNLQEQISPFIWCVSCKYPILHGLHKLQSYFFSWEKEADNCLLVAWCKTIQIVEVMGFSWPQTVFNIVSIILQHGTKLSEQLDPLKLLIKIPNLQRKIARLSAKKHPIWL